MLETERLIRRESSSDTPSCVTQARNYINLGVVPTSIALASLGSLAAIFQVFEPSPRVRSWAVLGVPFVTAFAMLVLTSINVPARLRIFAQFALSFTAYETSIIFWNAMTHNPNYSSAQWAALLPIMTVIACYMRQTYDDIRAAKLVMQQPDDFVPSHSVNDELRLAPPKLPWYAFLPSQWHSYMPAQVLKAICGAIIVILGTQLQGKDKTLVQSGGYNLIGWAAGQTARAATDHFDEKFKNAWFLSKEEQPPRRVVIMHSLKICLDTAALPVSTLVTAAFLGTVPPFSVLAGFGGGIYSHKIDQAMEDPTKFRRPPLEGIEPRELKNYAWKVGVMATALFPTIIVLFLGFEDFKEYYQSKSNSEIKYKITWANSFIVGALIPLSWLTSFAIRKFYKPENNNVAMRHLRYFISENPIWMITAATLLDHAGAPPITNNREIGYLTAGLAFTAASVGNNLYRIFDDGTVVWQTRTLDSFSTIVTIRNLWDLSTRLANP